MLLAFLLILQPGPHDHMPHLALPMGSKEFLIDFPLDGRYRVDIRTNKMVRLEGSAQMVLSGYSTAAGFVFYDLHGLYVSSFKKNRLTSKQVLEVEVPFTSHQGNVGTSWSLKKPHHAFIFWRTPKGFQSASVHGMAVLPSERDGEGIAIHIEGKDPNPKISIIRFGPRGVRDVPTSLKCPMGVAILGSDSFAAIETSEKDATLVAFKERASGSPIVTSQQKLMAPARHDSSLDVFTSGETTEYCFLGKPDPSVKALYPMVFQFGTISNGIIHQGWSATAPREVYESLARVAGLMPTHLSKRASVATSLFIPMRRK